MQKIRYPLLSAWPTLAQRPAAPVTDILPLVNRIFDDIRRDGDEALVRYCRQYDGNDRPVQRLSHQAIAAAADKLEEPLKLAIQLAAGNITQFHAAQRQEPLSVVTMPGVSCRLESRPIDTVGLYIPGGSAPLFSTVLMLGIPARLAGCREVVLCTPSDNNGAIDLAILYAADLVGIRTIFGIGGIQAIGAMSIGTDAVPKVDKLFGPGNAYVTAAKQVAQLNGTAIDMPAGPSEVLVIAGNGCNPAFITADLLSQAEHGPDSQVLLLSDDEDTIDNVLAALEQQLQALPRADIARQALQHSKAILLESLKACLDFSNHYAPEHLILAMDNAPAYTDQVQHAGSVFLGPYSCESAGDYASGTNHTLPTNGYARSYSGVSLDAFLRKISFQEISAEGLRRLGPAIELMAEAEQLYAHKQAVTIRLKSL
ncbi:histidinol dehydrogenase [Taibaiella koreensis]|uniref:histidinol dehydrogenase n=1 Tax=Taibaiella koreensis TaxID=1268548 RepID=UPI000E59B6FC|nr:histidinol dehydrogenase [Taibaiella koreensis]